jgi:hypothetical protein
MMTFIIKPTTVANFVNISSQWLLKYEIFPDVFHQLLVPTLHLNCQALIELDNNFNNRCLYCKLHLVACG